MWAIALWEEPALPAKELGFSRRCVREQAAIEVLEAIELMQTDRQSGVGASVGRAGL